MKTLYKSSDCKVVLDGVILSINKKRFGFKMKDTEGVNRIVIHKKIIEKHSNEYGFLVPKVIINCSMLFEVKFGEDKYTHYHYYPKRKNRLIPTDDYVFIGLGPLELIAKATHIKKVNK